MKNPLALLLVVITLHVITSCAQNRQLVQQTPFKITEQYFTSWVASQPANSSGMDIFINIAEKPDNITLKTVFFKGNSAALNLESEGLYSAHFMAEEKADYNISTDMGKETNNPKPQLPVKAPVAINSNEALLIYTQDGKEHYFKLEHLKDKGTKYPAEAPFNKND